MNAYVLEAWVLSVATILAWPFAVSQLFAGAFATQSPGVLKRYIHVSNALGFTCFLAFCHDPQGVFGRCKVWLATVLVNNEVGLIGYGFIIYGRGVIMSQYKSLGKPLTGRFALPFFVSAVCYHIVAVGTPIAVYANDRSWWFAVEQLCFSFESILLSAADLM
jgi:hypothetical protein